MGELGLNSLQFRTIHLNIKYSKRDWLHMLRLFPLAADSRTDKHSRRRRGQPTNTEKRHNIFKNNVITFWNSVPQRVMNA